MAKKSKAAIEPFANDKEKKLAIERWAQLNDEVDAREAEIKTIRDRFTASMEVRDYFDAGLLRVNIMQNWTRRIDWKKTAVALARMLYPEQPQFMRWLKKLVKDNPKQPTKAFAKLFVLKAEED